MVQTAMEEKVIRGKNGVAFLLLDILLFLVSIPVLVFGIILIADYGNLIGIAMIVIFVIMLFFAFLIPGGLNIIKPNEALVLALFGKYYGTIYESGFHFVNPFTSPIYPKKRDDEAKQNAVNAVTKGSSVTTILPVKKVSTKVSTFANPAQKVNDKLGNPIEVSAIVVWKVVNATKAVINVDNYSEYLSDQTDSTIRNVARLYPYDLMDDEADENDDSNEMTLRGSATVIAQQMKEELSKMVVNAGIEIVDVRLNQIAYSTEIAAAMLQRQQAVAIIAARKKIVEGAVSMVEMALDQLKKDGVVDLDEERKAAMVSNLLVVLCGNKEANPVVNTGSIY